MNEQSPSTTPAADTGRSVDLVDPRTLLVDSNIRHDLRLDKPFLASIKDLGVVQPLVVVRTAQGDLRVRFGHRRVAAAIEVGRDTVPVIVAADEGTDDAATVERLVTQYAENEHRTGLNNAERLATIEQMSLLGVSAAQISKRLKAPRREVDAALTVTTSLLAKAATVRYDFLDLTQAATVAEFDEDEDAVKALVASAKVGQFDHVAQRLRDERKAQQRRQAYADALRDSGVTVITWPDHTEKAKRLNTLADADGQVLTPEAHADCPGHAAYVGNGYGYVDPSTGRPVTDDLDDSDDIDDADDSADEASGDPDDEDDADAAADTEPVWGPVLTTQYVCTDPSAYGHADRYRAYDSGSSRPKAADMTEQQRAEAKAERRDVIESNKAWKSAEVVRRDWLRVFLSRKSAPKTAGRFLALALARADHALTQALTGGHSLGADLLGLTDERAQRGATLPQAVTDATDARAQVIHLGLVLCAYEASTGTHSWRSVNDSTAAYLTFLAEHGYALSPVERRACGLPAEPGPAEQDDTDLAA